MSVNTFYVELGEDRYVNPAEVASEAAFGAEFLGWEFFQNFENRFEEVDFHHVRWPGGIPVEDGINTDFSEDRSLETTVDLTSENYVTWDRLTGDPREGIREMLEFSVDNDLTLAVVLPTARYVEIIREEGHEAGIAAARSDIRDFTERLVSGEFGELPSAVKLEIGSEYYSTQVWKHYTTDDNGIPYSVLPDDLVRNFGDVFAAMTDEIDDIRNDPNLNTTDANVEIHVQLGRQGDNPNPNVGGVEDNIDFIEALLDVGALDAVDSLIYHRYIPTFDNIDRGIDIYSGGNILSDTIGLWEEAGGGQEFDLTVGWLSPAAQSTDNPEFNAPGLTNILQFSSTLLANGMDTGSIFGLGHSSEGSLGWRSEVLMGGRLYELMAESIPGTYVVEGYLDNTSHVVYGTDTYVQSDDINSYVFQNDEQVVIFLAARDFAGESLDYTLSFDEQFSEGELTRLWDTGEVIYNPSTGEEIGHIPGTSVEGLEISEAGSGSEISVTFNQDYEILRLVLDLDDANTVSVWEETAQAISFSGSSESDLADGSYNDDLMWGGEGGDTLKGKTGDDKLNGNEGDDRLFGDEGDDTVKGGWGDDLVSGDDGDDRLSGEWGDDTLLGGAGADTMFGFVGDDIINGGLQDDIVYAGDGDDVVNGGYGRDVAFLGDGDDIYQDTAQDNELGDDIVEGGAGDDLILGVGGSDTYYGNEGNNTLVGGVGNDTLFLTGDNDVANGGLGDDLIFADAQSTTIVLDVDHDEEDPGQVDTVFGFDIGTDFVELMGEQIGNTEVATAPAQFLTENARINGEDLEISLGQSQTLILSGIVSGDYQGASVEDFAGIFAASDTAAVENGDSQNASDEEEDNFLDNALIELLEMQLVAAFEDRAADVSEGNVGLYLPVNAGEGLVDEEWDIGEFFNIPVPDEIPDEADNEELQFLL